MWPRRGRTKKLIVAFHFLRGDQAGWKCDTCRRQGLESRRRCGFLPADRRGPVRTVWARGKTGTQECPKSLITPASVELLEAFVAWKSAGPGGWMEITARQADAFAALEAERQAEVANGG